MSSRFDYVNFYMSWNNTLKYIFWKWYVNLELGSAWFSWKQKKSGIYLNFLIIHLPANKIQYKIL